MSHVATNATYQRVLPGLDARLKTLPTKTRPSHAACIVVALVLADRLRSNASHVDETVGQIVACTGLSTLTVRAALKALDELGIWVVEARGNRHKGSQRRPTFMDLERGSSPDEYDDVERGSSPATQDGLQRGIFPSTARGDDTYSAGFSPLQRGADPATPPTTPCLPPSSSCDDDRRRAKQHLERHIDWKRDSIDKPHAFREAKLPQVLDAIGDARASGEDPDEALERQWQTRPSDEASFDPADWTALVKPAEPTRRLEIVDDDLGGIPTVKVRTG